MTNNTGRRVANAIGGKTTRACDGCLQKRARWYCTADDAFLCQVCDVSVHSANQLASRHERVRLRTSSSFSSSSSSSSAKVNSTKIEDSLPITNTWDQGFTRRARTQRLNNNRKSLLGQEQEGIIIKDSEEHKILEYNNYNNNNKDCPVPFVPEVGNEDQEGNYIVCDGNTINEDDQDLLFRVPVFDLDPFEEDLCEVVTSNDHIGNRSENIAIEGKNNNFGELEDGCNNVMNDLQGFLPSYMDLVEFTTTEFELESLLGREVDEDSLTSDVKNLGLLINYKEENNEKCSNAETSLKVIKEEEAEEAINGFELDHVLDMAIDIDDDKVQPIVDWNKLSYESPVTRDEEEEEEEEKIVVPQAPTHEGVMKRYMCLRLNYEAVINAWASQGSPWTTGIRPVLNFDDSWPNLTVYKHFSLSSPMQNQQY